MCQNTSQEMVARRQLRLELGRRVYGRVDLSAQGFLNGTERIYNFAKTRLTDHEEVNVASGTLLVTGKRAVNEGENNTISKRRQGSTQTIAHTARFCHQAFKLGEDRTARIGLVEHLIALDHAPDDASRRQLLDFAFDRAYAGPKLANHLPEIERLVSVAIEQRQNSSARFAEQDRRERASRFGSTHIGYDCTSRRYAASKIR